MPLPSIASGIRRLPCKEMPRRDIIFISVNLALSKFKEDRATFLELDIIITDSRFVYKLFDKRDAFLFSIVRMPDLYGNIPEHIFYGSISAEFLGIDVVTLLCVDFVMKSKELTLRMLKQSAMYEKIRRCLGKAFGRHPSAFSSYGVDILDLR